MKYLHLLILSLLLLGCKPKEVQKATVINLEDIIALSSNTSEKIQVINFWATWCKPCVDELPVFEELQKKHPNKVEVILISLDDIENIDSKVNLFIKENNIQSQVKLLDHPYAAEYIPIIDKHWDGAIPVTLIKHQKERKFFNQTFDFKELNHEVEAFLNKS